jgi:hypothetical protein
VQRQMRICVLHVIWRPIPVAICSLQLAIEHPRIQSVSRRQGKCRMDGGAGQKERAQHPILLGGCLEYERTQAAPKHEHSGCIDEA